MLTELCHELKNWFVIDNDKHIGAFVIENGVITPSLNLRNGQYYRIVNSVFNDGVHKYGDATDVLTDEEFTGAVWCMAVPHDVIVLDQQIDAYNAKYDATPYTSESFGGYSYSKATGKSGAGATWQDVFARQLNRWRKI